MKLLNEIPALDKGFVAGLSFNLTDKDLEYVWIDHLAGQFTPKLLDIASATLVIKCPLFIQLWLGGNDLTILSSKQVSELEAYMPVQTDIGTGDLQLDAEIAEDIRSTTDALLINPKAYVHDGCEKFISQITTPISVYNQLVVSGSLSTWLDLLAAKNLPKLIEAYRNAIREVLVAEWKKLPDYEEQLTLWQRKNERSNS